MGRYIFPHSRWAGECCVRAWYPLPHSWPPSCWGALQAPTREEKRPSPPATGRTTHGKASPGKEGGAPWVLGLGLRSLGRQGSMTAVAPGTVRAEGNRVEQRRDGLGLTEWYVNLRSGIEQGFTVDRRPDAGGEDSPLVLDVVYGGGLDARQDETDGAVLFSTPAAGIVLRYA